MGLLDGCPDDILHLILNVYSKDDLVKLPIDSSTPGPNPLSINRSTGSGKRIQPPPDCKLITPYFRKTRVGYTQSERQRCVNIVRHSRVLNFQLWIDKLGSDSQASSTATMDAVLAVLLSQLPNLRSLFLGSNFAKETTLIRELKDVYFNPRIDVERRWGREANDQKPNNTLCPLTFFYAPSIQHITATIEEPVNFKWPSAVPPTPAKLESLNITLVRERSLGNILLQCHNLRRLTYNFYADKASKQRRLLPASISSSDLTHSLFHVRPKLKSLILTCFITDHDYDGHEMEPEGIKSPVTGFTEFSKLERLEVPFVFLLGNHPTDKIQLGSVLPRNLKTLRLPDVGSAGWHDQWDGWKTPILEVMETWLKDWREDTPQLEQIEIMDTMEENESLVETFWRMSRRTGLEIVVLQCEDQRDDSWPRVCDSYVE
ncbi:hypothetical protein BKA65DRAFT_544187 [Rhexocercosporidium sp. MPI-PUGE-AT-0058]|nr:hypothetical protein BKA65DRAFT_544187 [Rhexocercosporidium sp. MPI-PUGE-AT-0058]